jgi:hypothetical protein
MNLMTDSNIKQFAIDFVHPEDDKYNIHIVFHDDTYLNLKLDLYTINLKYNRYFTKDQYNKINELLNILYD